MFIAMLLTLATMAWMAARIGRRNPWLAVVSLLAWPVLAFAMIRYWNDEVSDIRVPFLVFVPALWIAATMA
jgi:positive regulator of sigma E activity